MRFLLIETSDAGEDVASFFDTGNLALADTPAPELMDFLDFIERNPEYPLRNRVPFWEFVTAEIVPPEVGLPEYEKNAGSGGRFLEVYALGFDDPFWEFTKPCDIVSIRELRHNKSLFALVPLRRGKPHLRVVNGQP